MIADLKSRYINSSSVGMIIIGIMILIVYCGAVLIWYDLLTFKLIAVIFIVLLFNITIGSSMCYASPVRKFKKKYGSILDEAERSYLYGIMITDCSNSINGINIGMQYIIIFTLKEVILFRTDDVVYAIRSCTHEKQYDNGIYSDSVFHYSQTT